MQAAVACREQVGCGVLEGLRSVWAEVWLGGWRVEGFLASGVGLSVPRVTLMKEGCCAFGSRAGGEVVDVCYFTK